MTQSQSGCVSRPLQPAKWNARRCLLWNFSLREIARTHCNPCLLTGTEKQVRLVRMMEILRWVSGKLEKLKSMHHSNPLSYPLSFCSLETTCFRIWLCCFLGVEWCLKSISTHSLHIPHLHNNTSCMSPHLQRKCRHCILIPKWPSFQAKEMILPWFWLFCWCFVIITIFESQKRSSQGKVMMLQGWHPQMSQIGFLKLVNEARKCVCDLTTNPPPWQQHLFTINFSPTLSLYPMCPFYSQSFTTCQCCGTQAHEHHDPPLRRECRGKYNLCAVHLSSPLDDGDKQCESCRSACNGNHRTFSKRQEHTPFFFWWPTACYWPCSLGVKSNAGAALASNETHRT